MKRTNKINSYIKLARRMAANSDYPTFRHGAILVKGGNVLNVAWNKNHFNRFGARFHKIPNHATAHAELGTILGIDISKTAGATVYVVRINNNGRLMLSKPCSMCAAALKHVGVKKIVFSENGGNLGVVVL